MFLLQVGEGQYRGIVSLARPLDYEQRSAYTLQLRATDGAADPSNRLSTVARVAVQVTDVQDQPPAFLNAPYSATVPEGSPPVSRLLSLSFLVQRTLTTFVAVHTFNNARRSSNQ